LFSNCEINFIAYSLGTHVVLSCLETLQTLRIINYRINNIILLGGVACKNKFAELNEEVIQCNIFNVYSQYDDVLPLAFKNFSEKVHPCGLMPI
jgi:ribosome biogenesis protein Tsr3